MRWINSKIICLLLISFSIVEASVTILTDIIGKGSPHSYGGHPGVTRSLVEGLRKINYDFNYNPASISQVKEVMVVLAGIEALQQAIILKRDGKIKKLLAGPNLMVRANEYHNILSAPEIDVCIVPSDWVKIAYEEDAPALIGRIKTWYAGIDENAWIPHRNPSSNNVLVYWKTEPELFCCKVENTIRKYGFNPIRVTYGRYDKRQLKELLNNVAFAIFISISESQGLALVESWVMDVPTIVWNMKKLIAHNREYNICSACPYLTAYTGKDWETLEDLEKLLKTISRDLPHFTPRRWVLEHMTDVCSARAFLHIIEEN